MTSPSLLRSLQPLALAAACVLWVQPAKAERADRTQPLQYEADGGRADERRGVYELKGNVVITQGTLTIRADRVELRDTPQGQLAVATGGPGKPVNFRQKREGTDDYVDAQAQRVEYDTQTQTVRLLDQAVLRRVRGTSAVDEVSGDLITYNNETEVFEVSGKTAAPASSASAPAASGGRVKGTLAPRDPQRPPGAASGASR